jgi:UDP-glucose 4-epimerase
MKITDAVFCVTGGAGFIGSALVRELRHAGAAEIRVFDVPAAEERLPEGARFFPGDLRRPDEITEAFAGAHGVFHMAVLPLGPCENDPRLCVDINVVGTLNVIEAARQSSVAKIVFSSASSVYGDTPEVVSENHPLQAQTFYGSSKIAGELLLRAYHARHGISYVALRYMNVYGPGQAGGLIPAVLSKLEAGEAPLIHGDGSQSFDFVHVNDIVRANLLAMESDFVADVFNVGGDTEVTVTDLVHRLIELTGSDVQPIYDTSADVFMTRRVGSSAKARRVLGYSPSVSLAEGLRSVVEARA